MTKADVANLCYSTIIDGGTDDTPMTVECAEITLHEWKNEDEDFAKDFAELSPEEFTETYNEVLAYFHHND